MRSAPPQGFFAAPAVVDVEIDADPIQHGSVRGPNGVGSTQKPPVHPFSVTTSKGYLARAPGSQTGGPDSTCLFVIVGMQKSNVRIPLSADVNSETKRMVLRQSDVIRTS